MTDIKTLVERLRTDAIFDNTTLGNEAADAIEALQGEVEQVKGFWKEAQLRNRNLLEERDALAAELAGLKAQEPVAVVDANDDGFWADILPNRDVKVGQQLFAAPKALEPTTWKPASSPPPESAGEVLVRMADGRCEIAWPTYWHGSSNAFAQWTFRDPDEDEQPVEWMTIPSHGITKGTP